MPNRFNAIGFPAETDEDIEALAEHASSEGDALAGPSGFYVRYRVDDRIDLWAQATPMLGLLECVPYFRGDNIITMAVVDLTHHRARPLDGNLYGWVNPREGGDAGDYPIAVQIPDYEAFRSRVSPRMILKMNITAFPYQIDVYPTDNDFAESQGARRRMAPETFIPSGLFSDPSTGTPPEPRCIFSGHIKEAAMYTNPESRLEFYRLSVSTYGATYDVVIDPRTITALPKNGSVVRGAFHLVGRMAA